MNGDTQLKSLNCVAVGPVLGIAMYERRQTIACRTRPRNKRHCRRINGPAVHRTARPPTTASATNGLSPRPDAVPARHHKNRIQGVSAVGGQRTSTRALPSTCHVFDASIDAAWRMDTESQKSVAFLAVDMSECYLLSVARRLRIYGC